MWSAIVKTLKLPYLQSHRPLPLPFGFTWRLSTKSNLECSVSFLSAGFFTQIRSPSILSITRTSPFKGPLRKTRYCLATELEERLSVDGWTGSICRIDMFFSSWGRLDRKRRTSTTSPVDREEGLIVARTFSVSWFRARPPLAITKNIGFWRSTSSNQVSSTAIITS